MTPDRPTIAPDRLERFATRTTELLDEAARAIKGQAEAMELILACVLARGHVLLEGVPGIAKTLMARALAHQFGVGFKRIQFTPDLMPADITGTRVFDFQRREFTLVKGPMFTEVLLADEINRSPAKTQSALLEAMQERQVTIDGESHALPTSFTVFATQNPIEQEGTYPLPEAQLDRFLFKLLVGYPDAATEDEVIALHHAGFDGHDLARFGLAVTSSPAELEEMRALAQEIHVKRELIHYAGELVRATRASPTVQHGAGPRAGIALVQGGKAMAALRGRDFATPDDLRAIAHAVLRHRLILHPDAEIEGTTTDEVATAVLESVDVPR